MELDFKDVLIKPTKSEISSRKDANILRKYEFPHCSKTIEATGIMASNMFTTGTFEIAKKLQEQKMFSSLHKHYTAQEVIKFLKNNLKTFGNNDYVFISTGIREQDWQRLDTIMATNLCNNILLDVPNGYITSFLESVKRIRKTYPDCCLFAGNVVTRDMCEEIIANGADGVKVGIGSGCFAGNMKVLTNKGLKEIQDIKIGEKVLTHLGDYQPVTKTYIFNHETRIISINGIICTPNHEFYVIHESHLKDSPNYFKWIPAGKLNKEYYLIKDNKPVPIISIEKGELNAPVYDLEVGGENGSHSYNIEGIIVHNSVCRTRLQTGIGRPQLSAILDCSKISKGLIISDGGCTYAGDVCKAFAAGADIVMIGSMFAGTTEANGKIITKKVFVDGKKVKKQFKTFFGMASNYAQKNLYHNSSTYKTSEGVVVDVDYIGSINNVLQEITGGLRSAMTYTNCKTLEEFQSNCFFYEVKEVYNRVYEGKELSK